MSLLRNTQAGQIKSAKKLPLGSAALDSSALNKTIVMQSLKL